jgi:thioredoxin reductase (NADPH)
MASERRPTIIAVDDEPAVLATMARDLRRGFGERYRIVRRTTFSIRLSLTQR